MARAEEGWIIGLGSFEKKIKKEEDANVIQKRGRYHVSLNR